MNGKIMLNGKAYSSSGRPSREITMAQWLALPDTKYTDGIVYYIKDIGGANQFPPLIYSDEEREIGVWRDGKPLYQRTYQINITNNIDNLVDPEFTNRKIIRYEIDFTGLVDNDGKIIENAADTLHISNGSLYYYFSRSSSWWQALNSASITVWYTKTTDIPGSGTWTTDGTYAHHYSTSEKVIGTWTNGKPLYERIFITPSLSGPYDMQTGIPFGIAMIVGGYWMLNDNNSMIGLNEWFASANYSYCHAELDGDIKCMLQGYTGVGHIILQYTKTTD